MALETPKPVQLNWSKRLGLWVALAVGIVALIIASDHVAVRSTSLFKLLQPGMRALFWAGFAYRVNLARKQRPATSKIDLGDSPAGYWAAILLFAAISAFCAYDAVATWYAAFR